MEKEQRKYPRLYEDLKALCKLSPGQQEIPIHVIDIGGGGMSFVLDRIILEKNESNLAKLKEILGAYSQQNQGTPEEKQEKISIAIRLPPKLEYPMPICARVVELSADGRGDDKYIARVRFTAIRGEDRQTIIDYIDGTHKALEIGFREDLEGKIAKELPKTPLEMAGDIAKGLEIGDYNPTTKQFPYTAPFGVSGTIGLEYLTGKSAQAGLVKMILGIICGSYNINKTPEHDDKNSRDIIDAIENALSLSPQFSMNQSGGKGAFHMRYSAVKASQGAGPAPIKKTPEQKQEETT